MLAFLLVSQTVVEQVWWQIVSCCGPADSTTPLSIVDVCTVGSWTCPVDADRGRPGSFSTRTQSYHRTA